MMDLYISWQWISWKWNSMKMKVKGSQSCPTFCHPMGYTVHGILQARLLEWVAFPFPRGSSQSRDRTRVSHTAGEYFTSWATRRTCWIPRITVKSWCCPVVLQDVHDWCVHGFILIFIIATGHHLVSSTMWSLKQDLSLS